MFRIQIRGTTDIKRYSPSPCLCSPAFYHPCSSVCLEPRQWAWTIGRWRAFRYILLPGGRQEMEGERRSRLATRSRGEKNINSCKYSNARLHVRHINGHEQINTSLTPRCCVISQLLPIKSCVGTFPLSLAKTLTSYHWESLLDFK